MKTSRRFFLKKFKFSGNTAFVLEFGHEYIRFYANHGQVWKDSAVYEIKTPYTLDDLWDAEQEVCRLQVTQNADVLYLWHPKYMKTLTRYGNTDWRLEDFELKNGPWDNMNTTDITIGASATVGTVTLTASGDVFSSSDVGRLIRLNLVNDTTTPWSASKSVSASGVYTSDGHWYQAQGAGTTGSSKPVHTEGTRSDGGVTWAYLHSGYGIAEITGVTDGKTATAHVVSRLPDGIKTANWELGVFYPGAEYPVAGTFFRNRLVLLANTAQGLKCFFSKTDDFDNFADKDFGEVLAENAFTVPILSDEYNEARWVSAGDVLFVGSNNGEFYIDALSSGEAMGADNVKVTPISNIGSKAIQPINVNGHTLFVDRFGTSIFDLAYSYERDGYDPFDATIKGKHLLKSGIIEWDYQPYQDKILWCAVGDGGLVGFTFNTEQQVTALHQHRFSGSVESVAVIPSPTDKKDDVWLSVRRNIDGGTKRYIEWMDEGSPIVFREDIETESDLDKKEAEEASYVKNNAWYIDSALEFNRSAGDDVTELNGLEHLEGMVVRIMADGAEKVDQIVENGKIKIDKTDNHVVIGLPMQSIFKAQKRYIQTDQGAGVGEVQRIDRLCLMLYRSGGGKVGGSFKTLTDILYRADDAAMGSSYDLFTGNKIIPWQGRTTTLEEKGADIIISNDSIFPMTILAISPRMTCSES